MFAMNNDTIYFREKCAPGGFDWLHCKVISRGNGVVTCEAPAGFGGRTEKLEFPLTQVQRIVYGADG